MKDPPARMLARLRSGEKWSSLTEVLGPSPRVSSTSTRVRRTDNCELSAALAAISVRGVRRFQAELARRSVWELPFSTSLWISA